MGFEKKLNSSAGLFVWPIPPNTIPLFVPQANTVTNYYFPQSLDGTTLKYNSIAIPNDGAWHDYYRIKIYRGDGTFSGYYIKLLVRNSNDSIYAGVCMTNVSTDGGFNNSDLFFNINLYGVYSIIPYYQKIGTEVYIGMMQGNPTNPSITYVSMCVVPLYWMVSTSGISINNPDFDSVIFSDEFGEPSTEDGYTGGTFDDSSDTIAIPTMPAIGVTSAGFVNVYNPSVGALQGFGAELFPDLTFSSSSHISGSSSVADAIEAAANALVDLGNQIPNIVNMYINSNLINYVIDCHILPVAPTIGAGANIKVGFKQFNATAPVVTSDYVDFDCGTLNVGEYYANFIDYSPYTRARLFLPFVGFVDLQPEFFQSGAVNIVYRFNIIDGSFMCYVLSTSSKSKLTNSVIMQFGGNACVHIPITGLNYSSMVSGVVGGAASMVASQAGVSGLNQRAGSAITSAITSAVDVAQSKPPVQSSNGYNATTSFLSVRTPYLLIERSVSNFSVAYTEEKGVPSNITTKFSDLSGFTQATAVHLDGIGATEAEKNEIAALLAQGVIL